MNDEPDLGTFRALLSGRRAELIVEAETGDVAARPVELDQAKVGRLSRMDAMQAQEMAKATERRRGAALSRITAAFGRIEQDEYGYCLTCGERIPDERLRIDPATPQCVRCAESAGR